MVTDEVASASLPAIQTHQSMRKGELSLTVVTSSSLSCHRSKLTLALFLCRVGPIDLWAPTISRCGRIDRVHLAVAPEMDFDFCFPYFCSKLAKIISRVRSVQMR